MKSKSICFIPTTHHLFQVSQLSKTYCIGHHDDFKIPIFRMIEALSTLQNSFALVKFNLFDFRNFMVESRICTAILKWLNHAVDKTLKN